MKRLLLATLVLAACDPRSADPPDGKQADNSQADNNQPDNNQPDGKQPNNGQPDSNTCMPGGLDDAKSLPLVRLPSGCRWTQPGTLDTPASITSAEQLDAALSCEAGVARPNIDLAAHDVEIADYMLSPAHGGAEVFDDGTIVTFVERQRSPCPDDPRPMPTPSTIAYLVAKGAARQHRMLACTLPPRCG